MEVAPRVTQPPRRKFLSPLKFIFSPEDYLQLQRGDISKKCNRLPFNGNTFQSHIVKLGLQKVF